MVEHEEDQGLLRLINQATASMPPVDRDITIGNSGHNSRRLSEPRTKTTGNMGWNKLYPEMPPPAARQDHLGKGPEFLFPDSQQKMFRQPEAHSGQRATPDGQLTQMGNRYIISQLKSGLIIIDQCHAHQRILFEKLRDAEGKPPLASQQLLFPRTITFSPVDFSFMREIEPQVAHLGFDLREFGANTYILHGVPAALKGANAEQFFEDIIAEVRETGGTDVKKEIYERLAKSVAMRTAMAPGKKLNADEMRNIVDALFQCDEPGFSPAGKPTWYRLDIKALEAHFQ